MSGDEPSGGQDAHLPPHSIAERPGTKGSPPLPATPVLRQSRSALARFFGWVLAVSGGLLLLVSGSCTSVFFILGVVQSSDLAGAALVIGAPAIAIGAGLFWWGKRLLKAL